MKTIKEMSAAELKEIFLSGQIIMKQASVLGAPAFSTDKVEGICSKSVGDMYVSACREIMFREDKSLFSIQESILTALLNNI
jgi:hypothetical protein